MSDVKSQRTMVAILRVLRDADGPIGSEKIAEELRLAGVELSDRTIRNYLAEADRRKWTENLGRRGRRLTSLGLREVEGALVIDKVGFVATRVDELAYQMTFDPKTKTGKVILNISTLDAQYWNAAVKRMIPVYEAGLGMGEYLVVGREGQRIGSFRVPKNCVAVGTICSVSMNGVLLRERIATTSRFGGLLEVEDYGPKRFTQVIYYEGTSLDPLEIFIRGGMTSVFQAARTGAGVIGASFREVPAVALPEVRRIVAQSKQAGLGGVLAIGRPNQPLAGIPVPEGRAGVIVCGGLNVLAAVVEAGIPCTNAAMSTLLDFEELMSYRELLPKR